MKKEFSQIDWDEATEDDCRQLVRLAVREDLDRGNDWTTLALAPPDRTGRAAVVVRSPGVVCGLRAARTALEEMDVDATWKERTVDGASVEPATCVAEISGPVRDLVTSERLVLNLIGRLSGVATLTRRFADAIAGLPARLYDTRKTTPGWRRLEKYAVRCGGGCNHRTGLFDAVLIKDNHLALAGLSAGEAVRKARRFLRDSFAGDPRREEMIVEVEVDSLEQLADALQESPEIILLDNMSLDELRRAVAIRDHLNPRVQLEASGGVRLDTVRGIAETGVERISVGGLTHAAVSLDIGLDWLA